MASRIVEDGDETHAEHIDVNSVSKSTEGGNDTLSKNQQKKKRRMEMKLRHRAEKRKLEREKRKERFKKAKLDGITLPPNRKQLKHVVPESMADVTVVIDCSFDSYMLEHDIKKLLKQIQHCYAINRRAKHRFKVFVTSLSGRLKEMTETLDGTSSWDVSWSEKSYEELFPREKIVYLAAESSNLLKSVETEKVYVIGGLVDHNSKKGLCYQLAVDKKINHAQLPITEYIDMKSRKVLTIDHVFDILQQQYTENDWESAFFHVIPKRKGAQSRAHSPNDDSDATDAAQAGRLEKQPNPDKCNTSSSREQSSTVKSTSQAD